MLYANQHLTAKINLPPSYMHLEAGDYLRFDELIGGKLAFGFDYTQEFIKNGQLIYPVFFVTKVAKSLSGVSLELVQVHRGDFGRNDGDVSNYLIPNPYDNLIYRPEFETGVVGDEEDDSEPYFEVEQIGSGYLEEGTQEFVVNTNFETSVTYEIRLIHSSHAFKFQEIEVQQGLQDTDPDATSMVNSWIFETDDPNGDNVKVQISNLLHSRVLIEYTEDSSNNIEEETIELDYDVIIKSSTNPDFIEDFTIIQRIPPVTFMLGDVNNDGVINVQDVVTTINLVLNEQDVYVPAADINEDGGLNILDITLLLIMILDN